MLLVPPLASQKESFWESLRLTQLLERQSRPGSCVWQEAAMLQKQHYWTMVRLNVLSLLPPCPAVCVCACRDYCCSHVGLCPTLQAVTVSQAGKKVSAGDGSGSCPLPLLWAKTLDIKCTKHTLSTDPVKCITEMTQGCINIYECPKYLRILRRKKSTKTYACHLIP